MTTQTNEEINVHIEKRYKDAIQYYWGASKNNKRWYKLTRCFTIILGALVTLIASLASSKTIVNSNVELLFTLGTPILAAILAIIAGFTQSFQWGSTWQNMVITAEKLEKEYDKFLVTPVDKRNYIEEAEKLSTFVINESRGFFERMLGAGLPKDNETI